MERGTVKDQSGTVTVKEVTTKSELRKFVDFPNKMYKDVKQFVPAFYGDDLDDWDKKKNPAFDYCEGKTFLAYKNGEIVGRIGAILSHKANEKWGTRRMRFSQVDFIDEQQNGHVHALHLLQELLILIGLLHHIGDVDEHIGILQCRL